VVGNNRAALMNFLSPATMAADNYFPEFPPPADYYDSTPHQMFAENQLNM
jgi:hypothetical protein